VAVLAAKEPEARRARSLAMRLGLTLLPPGQEAEADLFLAYVRGRLEIRPSDRAFGPVCVDFSGARAAGRRRSGGVRAEGIARAVGLARGGGTVVDATAGLGRDAFVLAALGGVVTAVERCPVVAALLEDGLIRAVSDPDLGTIVPARLRLVVDDARTYLSTLEGDGRPEVVVLDPMFPPRKKSARVKKEMQLFQVLVGPEPDAEELLAVARCTARRKVVVKRPVHAPPLAPDTSATHKGKTVRWDVYLTFRGSES